MDKSNMTLEDMIVSEKDKLKKLENKQIEIAKKIKICKANIEKYTLMKENQRFNQIANVLDNKGISMEDILSAVAAGDLLTLQEKIENTQNVGNTDEE